MKKLFFACILNLARFLYSQIENRDELLKEDPSLWPGHLQPFGAKQNKKRVKELYQWPSPLEFFTEYIDKNQPVLFKKVALESPAYKLFNDDFLESFPNADKAIIYAEPEKKENRTKKGFDMSFKEFVKRYKNESLYMVNALPMELRKYVRMPPPLRCNETRTLMSSQVTWFSSGGTKSVIHNDDVDNINCLYRGTKQLTFVDYNKYKKFVRIDHPEGGYSSIDVDRVDYVKFPELRNVEEYIEAIMEQGDCLFIPYHWYHQVNSKANENGQNLAVNVWFRHVTGHRPRVCDVEEEESTLDKYYFPDDEGDADSDEEDHRAEHPGYIDHFETYVKIVKKPLKLEGFVKLLMKDGFMNRDEVKLAQTTKEILTIAQQIFEKLDADSDGALSMKDFSVLKDLSEEMLQELEFSLSQDVATLEDTFEDIIEEEFQKNRKSEENKRIDDEL